ncbi:MAG: potassium transporter Kup [Amaricoccus sp.]
MVEKVPDAGESGGAHGGFWKLVIGSIGVVYGDIGTSPLYALREALHVAGADGLERRETIGIVSLLLWTLILIVTLKYVVLILRADNNGEGGTLSLLALAQRAVGRRTTWLFALGVAGAALFYGDAAITPAISVFSAVEGLELITPTLQPYVLPITVLILVGLFWAQAGGTARIAAGFGPITLLWFVVLAVLGLRHAGDSPEIFTALLPTAAIGFLVEHGAGSFPVMGSVFLAVTGAEALYADMGHFGRGPIRFAWIALVFPALGLNYLGQGALVLANPAAAVDPFYLLAPAWFLIPLILLATAATIIASQAVITGAYSLTHQAVQLGLLPRLETRHTSESKAGQIYMPLVNWILLALVLFLCLLFGSSSALANAYGIAVTGTMVVTSLLAFTVFRRLWRWSLPLTLAVVIPMLVLEGVFLAANLLKLFHGGYVPVVLGAVFALLMVTWVRGTAIVRTKAHKESVPLESLIRMLKRSQPARVKGSAVFLTSDPDGAPSSLLHNLKHNKVLHERNVVLTISSVPIPRVADADRLTVETLDEDFTRLRMKVGYMEQPNVPRIMALARQAGVKFDIMNTSFFLSRRSFRPSPAGGMPLWQDQLFIAMTKAASDASAFYRLPSNRVLELGQQLIV